MSLRTTGSSIGTRGERGGGGAVGRVLVGLRRDVRELIALDRERHEASRS